MGDLRYMPETEVVQVLKDPPQLTEAYGEGVYVVSKVRHGPPPPVKARLFELAPVQEEGK